MLYWTVVFPLFCLFSLIKNKSRLDQSDMKFRFGFFYIGYKDELFFWEFIIMYRKILTICVSMVNDSFLFAKGALILLINSTSLLLQISKMPFTDQTLNLLESSAIKVSLITIFSGLFYIQDSFGDVLKAFIFVIIVIVNTFFLLTWLRLIMKHAVSKYSHNKIVRKIGKFLDRLNSIVSESISITFVCFSHFNYMLTFILSNFN